MNRAITGLLTLSLSMAPVGVGAVPLTLEPGCLTNSSKIGRA
jgi:hypothetical protein